MEGPKGRNTVNLSWKGKKQYKLKDIQNSTNKKKVDKIIQQQTVISFMKKKEWMRG